jgi:hypothetical protein
MYGDHDMDDAANFSMAEPMKMYGFRYMDEVFFIHDFVSRRIPLLRVWLHRWAESDQVLHPVPPETIIIHSMAKQPFMVPAILQKEKRKNRATKKTLTEKDNLVMAQLKTFDKDGAYKALVPTPAHMRAIIAYGYTNDIRFLQDQYKFKEAMAVIGHFFSTDDVYIIIGDKANNIPSDYYRKDYRSPLALIVEHLYRMNVDLVRFFVRLFMLISFIFIAVGLCWMFNLSPPAAAMRDWINTTIITSLRTQLSPTYEGDMMETIRLKKNNDIQQHMTADEAAAEYARFRKSGRDLFCKHTGGENLECMTEEPSVDDLVEAFRHVPRFPKET